MTEEEFNNLDDNAKKAFITAYSLNQRLDQAFPAGVIAHIGTTVIETTNQTTVRFHNGHDTPENRNMVEAIAKPYKTTIIWG